MCTRLLYIDAHAFVGRASRERPREHILESFFNGRLGVKDGFACIMFDPARNLVLLDHLQSLRRDHTLSSWGFSYIKRERGPNVWTHHKSVSNKDKRSPRKLSRRATTTETHFVQSFVSGDLALPNLSGGVRKRQQQRCY